MDRIDAMKVFVAALDEGSLAGAGRRLGKSRAAVSRAITFLEDHVDAQLPYRTIRSIRLSEAGDQLTREGTEHGTDHVTREQKAAIHKGVDQVLSDVLKKPPEWTCVVFQEVEMETWGWGGMPVAEYRKRLKAREDKP